MQHLVSHAAVLSWSTRVVARYSVPLHRSTLLYVPHSNRITGADTYTRCFKLHICLFLAYMLLHIEIDPFLVGLIILKLAVQAQEPL